MKWILRGTGIAWCLLAVTAQAETAKVGAYTYTYRVVDGKAEIYNNGNCAVDPKPQGALNIPAQLNGLPVNIGDSAFVACYNLTSVVIPEGVTSIGRDAFAFNYKLVSVKFPKSLVSITGDRIFCDAPLTSLTIPGGVTNINEDAFVRCANLAMISVEANNPTYVSRDGVLYDKVQKKLIRVPSTKNGTFRVPDDIVLIGSNAFEDSSRLTSIILHSNITKDTSFKMNGIHALKLSSCASLSSILVDEGNPSYTSVDGVLFDKNKTTLISYPVKKMGTAYRIPNSVTRLEQGAFRNCNGLQSVVIPEGVTDITFWAFAGCSNLTSLTLPVNVQSVQNTALFNCAKLASILVDSNNVHFSSVDGVLFDKKQTALVRYPCAKRGAYTIPDGVDVIRQFAFRDCEGLTSVVIPESVTFIGGDAFQFCTGLTSIIIPKNVTTMNGATFFHCKKLASVELKCAKLKNETLAFDGTLVKTVIVPRDMGWTEGDMFGGKPVTLR